MTTILDEVSARIRAHRDKIHRYRRLLRTRLSELERQFIERRLAKSRPRSMLWPPKPSPSHLRGFRKDGGRAMSDVHELLTRGSEKVIGHYRL